MIPFDRTYCICKRTEHAQRGYDKDQSKNKLINTYQRLPDNVYILNPLGGGGRQRGWFGTSVLDQHRRIQRGGSSQFTSVSD